MKNDHHDGEQARGSFVKPVETRIEDAIKAEPLSFNIWLLGFSFAVASNFMFLMAFVPGEGDYSLAPSFGYFHVVELCAFLLAGVLSVCVYFLVCRRRSKQAGWRPLLSISAALFFLGIACVGVREYVPQQTVLYAIFCGAPIGAGNALMVMLWGRAYSRVSPNNGLLHAALSFALGITLCVVIGFVHADFVRWILWIVYQALSLVALIGLKDGLLPRENTVLAAQKTDVRESSRYLWMALSSLYLFSAILGIYWERYASAVFYNQTLDIAVTWGVVALFVGSVFLKRSLFNFNTVYKVGIPLAVVLLLTDPFLSFLGSSMDLLSGIAWTACLAIFEIIAWTALSSVAHVASVSPDGLFSINRALSSLALAVGILIGCFVDAYEISTALSILMFIFLVVIIISYVIAGNARKSGMTTLTQSELEEDMRAVAQKYGLSEREYEVFKLLVQGRGESFIGNELYISPNTVKTHRRHIYNKLGVNSREELISFMSDHSKR